MCKETGLNLQENKFYYKKYIKFTLTVFALVQKNIGK